MVDITNDAEGFASTNQASDFLEARGLRLLKAYCSIITKFGKVNQNYSICTGVIQPVKSDFIEF